MAIENGNGSSGMVMPVQPMSYGNGAYGGYGYGVPYAVPVMGGYGYGGGYGDGFFGGDWIILFLFAMMFGGFGGGFGGWGNGMWGMEGMFPWLLASNSNTDNLVQGGFNQAATATTLSGIQSAITSGFGDTQLGIAGVNQNICQSTGQIQNSLCQGFAGTTAAVTGAQNAVTQQLYNNEIASLNRSFAEQTANSTGFSGVQSKLADCCCENRLATQGVQNAIIQDGAATRQAIAQGIQSIQDKLCDQELQAERRENAELRSRINMLDLAQSQATQTARLLADNAAQTQQIENYVRPQINPAYIVPNPYAYNFNPVNGWGNGCGWNNGYNPFGNVGYGNGTF